MATTPPVKTVPAAVPSLNPVVTEQPVTKEERRTKERDAVRKIVEDAATKHQELEKKFLKEDEEEAAGKKS